MSEHEPLIITDKREQKRQEARERADRIAERAQRIATDAQNLFPEEQQSEPLDETLARIDRIQELRELGRAEGLAALSAAELLELQALEEGARQDQQAAEGDTTQALTAFLVIIGHDGSASASSDVNMNLVIDREANVDDMFSGSSLVLRDINAATTGKHVIFGMSMSAQAMREKANAMQVMQGAMPGRRR